MELINKLTIAEKLRLILVIALFFVLMVGGVGYYYNLKQKSDIEILYNKSLIPIRDISRVIINSNENNTYLISLFSASSVGERNAYKKAITDNSDESSKILKDFESSDLTAEEKKISVGMSELRNQYKDQRARLIALALAGKNQEGLNLYKTQTKQIHAKYAKSLDDLLEYNIKRADELNKSITKNAESSNLWMLLTIIISSVLQILLSLTINKTITDPIKQAIHGLSADSSKLAEVSNQVNDASQKIAEGASEQASAIQETSSTIEETSSMVLQNKENTQQAAVLARQAKSFAEQSNLEMGTMMASMTDLKQSSSEIAKIMKVIDEIAFQTNILSLNAAVEAARAGDAGKGFAVVAEEVRTLAQRSAQAAKDTAVIIESNITLSESSAEVAKKVQDAVDNIGVQATKVSDLLEEIAIATTEQSQGVEQINRAISQMEVVLTSSASTADESASSSRILSDRVSNLKSIVDSLVILVDGAKSIQNSSLLLKKPDLKINLPKATSNVTSKAPLKPALASTRSIVNRAIAQKEASLPVRKTIQPEDVIPLNDF